MHSDDMVICSLNVRDLSNNTKRRETFLWLKTEKKFNFLQEVNSTNETEPYWHSEWGYSTIFTTFSSSRAGVAMQCSTTIFNFQFWNILPTPKEVKSSDQCSFCKESSETLLYLFWEFPFVKSFWNESISNWMENSSCFLKEELSFSSYLGLVNDTTNLVFHQALLISRYMIYMPSNVNDANNNNNNNNNNSEEGYGRKHQESIRKS